METPAHDAAHVPAIGEIHAITELAPLDDYPRQIIELARSRLGAGDDALAVSGAIGDANDALTRRLLALAESHLGPPPRRYVWLALGSHGRREQVLSSDQDSAIAFQSAPASDSDMTVKYFATLADVIVSALARAGIPLCDGGYMATNWRRPLDEYARLFWGWVESPQPEALLKAEVFLDVRPCHGELASDTLERILLTGGTRGPFRAQMARAALTFQPPLGWFGRLRTRGSTLDIKRGGTAAIVLLARLYALIAGSTEHSTVPRLRAASAAGTLNSSNAADLIDAYALLTDLRLRHQLEQADEGAAPDNRLRIERVPAERKADVQAALRLVREIQEVTALRFATHAVT
jgi:CBS domain-containing protein